MLEKYKNNNAKSTVRIHDEVAQILTFIKKNIEQNNFLNYYPFLLQ